MWANVGLMVCLGVGKYTGASMRMHWCMDCVVYKYFTIAFTG